jgi:cobalt-zinc-cadmium efflux system outer membrane protein
MGLLFGFAFPAPASVGLDLRDPSSIQREPVMSTNLACARHVLRGACLLVLMAAGCATSIAPHGTESSIARITGVADAVEFRTEGGPVDENETVGSSLSLADALRLALKNDPALQASLARVRVAIAEAEQARLWPNPILSVALRWPDGAGKPNIEAGLAANLLSILQTPGRMRAADNRLRAAAAESLVAALDLVANVREAYATAQALDLESPVLEQRREIVGKLLVVARGRLDAGEGTRTDVTVLDAQRVELEVEIAEVSRQRRDTRLQLARLVGHPSGQAEWALDPWAESIVAIEEARWVQAAMDHRPEIQERVWELAALGDDLRLARWALLEGASVGVDAQRNDVWEIGPSASLPLPVFDMGQAKRARVSAQQVEARHRLTQTRRQIVEEVRRSHASLSASSKNERRVESELIPIQERRRAEAEALYRAGESDTTSLFLAEQELRASQSKLIELRQQTAIAAIRLERAVGGPAIAERIRIPENPTQEANALASRTIPLMPHQK